MSTFCKPTQSVNGLAPAIMQSFNDFDGLSDFNPQLYSNKNSIITPCSKCNRNNDKSFLLLNERENIEITSVEEFLRKLNCTGKNTKVKVVSIFGNTGNGINHTMNHVFFKDEEVFRTSNNNNCCSFGVWVAFDPNLNIICLDTEGLLGRYYLFCIT